MSSTEILSLVEQYKEAQQLIEAAQAEMDDLKRQITEEMTRRDVGHDGCRHPQGALPDRDQLPAGQQGPESRCAGTGSPLHQDHHEPPLLYRLKGWFAMELLEEIKTAADDLTADELEKVLQYIQTVKHRRTAE